MTKQSIIDCMKWAGIGLSALLSASFARADLTLDVRHGSGGCSVTTVSNASPPVVTCDADPGLVDGDKVRVSNILSAGPVYSSVNGTNYVDRLTATTYSLYSDQGLTSPLSAPGAFVSGSGLEWMGKTAYSITISSWLPMLPIEHARAIRCDVAHGCLTNITVSANVATANIPVGHTASVGKQIGVWGETVDTDLNTEGVVITSTGATTITWNTTSVADGTYTNAMVSLFGNSGNPAWAALKTSCANTGNAAPMDKELACAYLYYVDRSSTAALNVARLAITEPERVAHKSFWCNTSVVYCGQRNDADYSRFGIAHAAIIYSMLDDAGQIANETERSTFFEKLLASKRTDPSCTIPTITTLTQTNLSISRNGTSLTGNGTLFETELTPGGIVMFRNGISESDTYIVASTASNTSATLTNYADFSTTGYSTGTVLLSGAIGSGDTTLTINKLLSPEIAVPFTVQIDSEQLSVTATSNLTWTVTRGINATSPAAHSDGALIRYLNYAVYYARPWQAGDCGALNIAKSHRYSMLAQPEVDGGESGQLYSDWWYMNLGMTGIYSYVVAGLAMAEDSTRARTLLEDAINVGWDTQIAAQLSINGGVGIMGGGYGWYRQWMTNHTFNGLARAGYPDLNGEASESMQNMAPWAWSGDTSSSGAYFVHHGDGSLLVNSSWVGYTLATKMSVSQRQKFQSMIRGFCGGTITQSCISDSARGSYVFPGYNPHTADDDLRDDNLVMVKRTGSKDKCTGARYCRTEPSIGYFVSRSSWSSQYGTGQDVRLHGMGGSYLPDHSMIHTGNYLVMVDSSVGSGAQPHFIGPDHSQGTFYQGLGTYAAVAERANMFVFSAHPRVDWTVKVSTAALDRASSESNSSYFYARADGRGDSLSPPTAAERHFTHFRGLPFGSIIVNYTRLEGASAGTIHDYMHFGQNGQVSTVTEGGTNCAGSPCSANTNYTGIIRSTNAASTKMVSVATVYPDTNKRAYRYLENTNGTYSGGVGYTVRWSRCATTNDTSCNASATGLHMVDVIVASATITSATAKTTANFEGVEAVTSAGNVVAMYANGSDQSSVTGFSTSNTADFFVAGLSAGSYAVRRNGVDVSGCENITVSSNDNSLYCPDVLSGTISVASAGSSPPVEGSGRTSGSTTLTGSWSLR